MPKQFNTIDDTLNYESLFQVVSARMNHPSETLEVLAQQIIIDIIGRFPKLISIQISIYKKQAPIKGLRGKIGITIKQEF